MQAEKGSVMTGRIPICFPFLAQVHQAFHSLPIAMELARRYPELDVHVASGTADHLDWLKGLAETFYPGVPVRFDLLRLPGVLRRFVPRVDQGVAPKLPLLLWNLGYFSRFEAVVTPERTTLALKRFLKRPRIIWTRHGAGDRASGFQREIAKFDFVLMAGNKIEQRLLAEGLVRPGRYATGVYAKFDLVRRMPRRRLFDNDRPTIVYNPHFWPSLSSWPVMGRRVLDLVAASDRYNLVFAPHIRLFYPPTAARYREFEVYRGLSHMRIDLGSPASADMTYTANADLYLGDVSSQVAEFVAEPRPCVFLNAHGVDWRGDPDYRFWMLGPVVEDVAMLEETVERAFATHDFYRARQQAYVRETFGACERLTAPIGADAIAHFLHEAVA